MMDRVRYWTQKHIHGDPVIWGIVLLLSIVSILTVYSATGTLAFARRGGDTEYFLIKHSVLIFFALGAMWLAHKVDYRYYSKISRWALYLSVPLILYAYFFGSSVNDANRWVTIPLINQSFQPSDLAKLALIANLASMLSKRQQQISERETLIPILFWTGLICGLIALSNFSTAVLLFATAMLIMFIGRVPVKYLFFLVLVGILAGGIALTVGQRGDTVKSRITQFFDSDNVHFQTQKSFIAIASGGALGKGPGHGDQRNYLPHPYSDFIYAVIIEEYGLAGGIFVLFLYLALLFRGMKTAAKSDRAFGGLLSAGLSFALVTQAMINMGVAVGVLPLTGLPLPFVSMGGTSLLFTGLSLGIILSVSRGEVDEDFSTNNHFKNLAKAA